jgi:hypothetical protein
MQLGIDAEQLHKLTPIPVSLASLRHAHSTPIGAPLIISSRQFSMPTSQLINGMNGSGPPPLISPADAGLIYAPYDFHSQYAALTSQSAALLAEYPTTHTGTAVIDSLTSTGGLFGR